MRINPRSNSLWGNTALVACCLALLALCFACGGGGDAGSEATEEPAAAAEPEPAEESAGAPRVFFIEPADGATVSSPVTFTFGHENFMIEPKGEIHAGAGHHHIGVDTDCLPPGTAIPEADPWVHFGDGSSTIEMQLTPGQHKLTIQIGDGEHMTLDEPGLCTSITVTVAEGGES